MPMAPPAAPAPKPKEKFAAEKATFGGVSFVTLAGTLNEAFEGRKLAESIKNQRIVVSLRDVRRFASWGMSEWMDFLRINAERDVYIVECSTYAVSQINLVTGLIGHCKLVSFYASYRCGSCSEELQSLFLIPRDRQTIRNLPGSHQPCPTCGGRAGLEEYPAAFFETIAARPSFDIDDEVLAFFRRHLGYDLAPDLTRFRAYRATRGGYTYLRLSGSLALLPSDLLAAASEGTTVADLAGVVFHPAEVAPWRAYVEAAMAKLPSLQLVGCPPGFLESAIAPEDLHGKLKVRTFALSYNCLRCETVTAQMVDVASNLEQLVAGVTPPAACPTCQSLLVAALTPELVAQLRALPARDRDPALDKFLDKASAEPVERLENCLLPSARKPAAAPAGTSRAVYIALGLSTVLVGALAAVALTLWSRKDEVLTPIVVPAPPADAAPPRPTFTRPDWIISDTPASAYCHEMINRLMCIGVSAYRPTRDDAVAEANDAALEELVITVGLKITDPFFRESVLPGYSAVRSKALSALQAADNDRTGAAYAAAAEAARKARKRVVEVFQDSGGPAVPSQRAAWYWEEYEGEKGRPNETLVFIRYDVPLDAVKALVERYGGTTQALGSSVMTAFPAVAWQHAAFTGGALITKVGRPLSGAGVAPRAVVVAVGDQRVVDAAGFARRLEEAARGSDKLTVTIQAGDAPEQMIEVKR